MSQRKKSERRQQAPDLPRELPLHPVEKTPPEMLEKIFTYVENNYDLVTCRQVAKQWTPVVTRILAKRCQELQKWNPLLHPEMGATEPVLQLNVYSLTGIKFVIKPAAVEGAVMDKRVNPLFSGCLRLIYPFGWSSRRASSKASKLKEKIRTVIGLHGDSLMSLSIVGGTVRQCELTWLLKTCKNLEFLQFNGVDWGDVNGKPLPDHTKLTGVDCSKCPRIYNLLLNNNANQLERITCLDTNVLPFTTEIYPNRKTEGSPFGKLKELKVVWPGHEFILKTGLSIRLTLERLSVIFPCRDNTCNELCAFTSRFWSTLMELAIYSELAELCVRIQSPVCVSSHEHSNMYPKLHKFYMNGGWDESAQMGLMKKHFLSNFPELQVLVIVFEKKLELESAWNYVEMFELWTFCRLLKTIEFVTNTGYHANPTDMKHVVLFKLTRQEWDEKNGGH